MDTSTQLTKLFSEFINVVLIPLMPVATTLIIAFLKRKTDEIKGIINNQHIAAYLDIAENAVITAVTAVNQTYVDAIKKENGQLSSEEKKTAFETAKEKALNAMGQAAAEAVTSLYNDLDTWLETKIEYYVNLFKTGSMFDNENMEMV